MIILNSFAEEESENVPSYYTIGSLCVTGTARVVKCQTPKYVYDDTAIPLYSGHPI